MRPVSLRDSFSTCEPQVPVSREETGRQDSAERDSGVDGREKEREGGKWNECLLRDLYEMRDIYRE